MGLSINLVTITNSNKSKKNVLSPQATPKRFINKYYSVNKENRYIINKLISYHYNNNHIEYNREQDILDIKAYIKSNNYQIYNENLRNFLRS